MRDPDLQDERILEINFVDVGRGDGALLITPNEERIVIDAGREDNLFWFLRWRWDLRRHPDRVEHLDYVVITHPDPDHYQGFKPIFESPQFTVATVQHNGIVERAGADPLGPTKPHDGRTYLMDLSATTTKLRHLLRNDAVVGRRQYPLLLCSALASGRVNEIRMTSAKNGHLPGFEPGHPLVIEVLGRCPSGSTARMSTPPRRRGRHQERSQCRPADRLRRRPHPPRR